MSCCDGIIKYLLFFFNLIFSLSGLALIIVGSLYLSNTSGFSDLVNSVGSGMKTPQIVLIVVGVIIFFIATLGCCGAIRENRCMLITFAICLLSIFIIQLAIGIYALTNKPDFTNKVEEGLRKEFLKIPYDPKVQEIFKEMEKNLECCGVKGFTDYITNLIPVPKSCCEDRNECRIRPQTYWKNGCAEAITNFTGKAGEALGGVAIGLSVIEDNQIVAPSFNALVHDISLSGIGSNFCATAGVPEQVRHYVLKNMK